MRSIKTVLEISVVPLVTPLDLHQHFMDKTRLPSNLSYLKESHHNQDLSVSLSMPFISIAFKKNFVTVDTRSNMQMSHLNLKPHRGQSRIDIIDRVIGTLFYPQSVSAHHKILRLDQFHNSSHCHTHLKK